MDRANAPGTRDGLSLVLACAVLALVLGPLATSVFVLGFVHGDSPCVLCWAQRTAMVLVALSGLFVLRYGPRPRYLGLAILVAAGGIYMGVRHAALHLARDVGQGFSLEILGAHTYTWSAFIFWVCIVTMAALLMTLKDGQATRTARTPRPIERATMGLFLLVVAGNIVQAFASTGPPPYMGQSDPIRFSFNPRHWAWSLEEWSPAPVSLRGRWSIEKPGLASLPADPDLGPLGPLPELPVKRRTQLALPVRGPVTDLAYEAATDRFLLTTDHGIYLADGSLGRLARHTVVDPGFSVDLARFGGAAFLDAHTVMAVSENKSFVVLRERDGADADANYRYFLESRDRFEEIARSRLSTVRARMMYVLSLAHDPSSGSLFTVSVPNRRTKRLVVSRFDRKDLTLSEEFLPALDAGAGLALRGEGRSLDELYVSGAAFDRGRLYALSAAYGTLLTIDPAKRAVVAAHAVRGLDRPAGVAVRGHEIYVVGETGTLTVLDRPAAAGQIADPAPR